MITIALADKNQTYCFGLKTMLEQVEDFRVLILSQPWSEKSMTVIPSLDILIADDDLYSSLRNADDRDMLKTRSIILVMEEDELPLSQDSPAVILRGAGKKEFEDCIRKVILQNKSI